MSQRYERVNAHDVDEPDSPNQPAIPNSPPPSFHSRASSPTSRELRTLNSRGGRTVDPALADAFDDPDADEDDESDDDADDRRRLMRSRDALRPVRGPMSSLASTASTNSNTSAQTPSTSTASATPDSTALSRPQPQPQPTGRVYGGGIQSDGVFSNLTARPEPGEEKDEQPPTYEQAAADAAPPYWETTILAPGLGGPDEVYVDGMPVGSIFSFIWNGMISMSFQIVGFLLTYLLHSTHAAKNGSRAGLGITLIQYGFYMKGTSDSGGGSGAMSAAGAAAAGNGGGNGYASPPDPNAHNFDPGSVGSGGSGGGSGNSLADIASSEWVAYILMIVGWFILIRAVSDYLKARRHEQLVLQSPDRGLGVAVIAEGENPEHVV